MKNVQGIVDGLTEEEKFQFENLIKESFEREAELEKIRTQTQESLKLLEEDLKIFKINLIKLQKNIDIAKEELLTLKYILSAGSDPIFN